MVKLKGKTDKQFLFQYPEARVWFPARPEKKKVVGLEGGPLSLVSTTEELLDRKVAATV
jgi:predicted amidohydrolase